MSGMEIESAVVAGAPGDWARDPPHPRTEQDYDSYQQVYLAKRNSAAHQVLWSSPYATKYRRPYSEGDSWPRSLVQHAINLAARKVVDGEAPDLLRQLLETKHMQQVLDIWKAIRNPRAVSFEHWIAIHSACKELGISHHQLCQNPPHDLVKFEDWHVVTALFILENGLLHHNGADGVEFRQKVDDVLVEMRQQVAYEAEGNKSQVLRHYRNAIQIPLQELSVYLKPLQRSAPFEFITQIRIAGSCTFSQQELMVLPTMQNLDVLELVDLSRSESSLAPPVPMITNDLLEAWSLMDNPFPNLLVLKVWSTGLFTYESLTSVACFPKLLLFRIQGTFDCWGGSNFDAMVPRALVRDWERISNSIPVPNDTTVDDEWSKARNYEYPNRLGRIKTWMQATEGPPVVSMSLGVRDQAPPKWRENRTCRYDLWRRYSSPSKKWATSRHCGWKRARTDFWDFDRLG